MKPGTVVRTLPVPEAIVLVPLLPAWALALLSANDHVEPVLVVGLVAVGSALLLGRLLWHRVRSGVAGGTKAWIQHGILVAGCAVLWVCLQYAFNPFRIRPTVDALLASRSAPWQLAAGFYLFAGVLIVARWRRSDGHAFPNAVRPAMAVTPVAQLAIRIGDRTTVVDVRDIERIQACDDHVAVVTGGRQMIASYRISDLADSLDASQFIRIHRSHIVNLAHVSAIQRIDANRVEVILKSGSRITASRSGSVNLRKKLTSRS